MRNRFFNSLISFLIIFCCAFTASAALEIKDDYRSPRNKERPVRKATRLIVLHTTEAHAKSSLNKLSERGEAHYCVTEEGEIYRIIDKEREAFHAGRSMWNAKEDCDEYSVGIEVVGYHNKTMPLKQLKAIKDLVAQLKKTYKLQDAQVVCHSHVAYGAPNTWHKKKHRGRKRCGMLFAMPSVRSKLGLRYRPAYDPDVRAKRLVQADSYLNSVLYGSIDTMSATYGKGTSQISAKPKQPKPSPVQTKPSPVQTKPSPVQTKPSPVQPKPLSVQTKPLPLPKDLHIRKMGDDVKDLAALAKLPGYTRGGPVSVELSPYKIAGPAWKLPTTYYYDTRGNITTGDKVDEKAVEAGTFIFYKK